MPDLKKIIKQYVRESLVEIFAEMNLETIVENTIRKSFDKPTPSTRPVSPNKDVSNYSIRDVYSETRKEQPVSDEHSFSSEEKRKIILEKLGTNDNTWKSIYKDTASSDNPILSSEQSSKPEYVPESVLEKAGLMKDYSKYIGMDEKAEDKKNEEEEWQALREKRKKSLEAAIKRTA